MLYRIYRFDRSDERWEQVLQESGYASSFKLASDSTGAIVAVAYQRTHRSTDDGRTWSLIDTTATLCAAHEGHLVVLLRQGGRSTDGGATWQATQPRYFYEATMLRGGRMIAVTDSAFVSDDTGRTWRATSVLPPIARAIVASDSTTVFVGTGADLARSTDRGETWTRLSIPGNDLAVDSSGALFLASFPHMATSRAEGLYRSTDRGDNWSLVAGGVPWGIGMSGENLWTCFQPEILRSSDGGGSWSREDAGLYREAETLLTDPTGALYAMLGGRRLNGDNDGDYLGELMRSDDDGRSWRSVRDSIASPRTIPGGWALLVHIGRPEHDRTWVDDVAWRTELSTDGGTTWRTLSNASSGDPSANASGMVVLPTSADTTEPDLLVSTDRGATWSAVSVPRYCVAATVAPSGRIYAGAYHWENQRLASALYRSDDTGRTWQTTLTGERALELFAVGDDVVAMIAAPDTGTGSMRIVRTANGGSTWTTAPTAHAMSIRDSSGTIMLFSSRNDSTIVTSSTDGFATTRESSMPGTIAPSWPQATPTNGQRDEVFAAPGGSLYRTMDHGLTWQLLDAATPERNWRVATANSRTIVASGRGGIFRTTSPSGVLPAPSASAFSALTLAPMPATDRLIVGLDGRGGTLRITDMRGRSMHEQLVDAGLDHVVVDISHFGPGVFVVELRRGADVSVGRVAVTR